MAKSLRSKRRRQMRAVRREKFGKKELEKLKGVVERAKRSEDDDMKEMFTEKTAAELKEQNNDAEQMDTTKASRNYDPKTMKNEHGNYPVWMSQRRVKKMKKTQRKKMKSQAKGK